jgi:hypothetical protein
VRPGLLEALVALCLPALSTEATAGVAPQVPYRLIQRDGTVVELAAPPQEKGSLLVGTLHPSGRLVSFPKASLEAAATPTKKNVDRRSRIKLALMERRKGPAWLYGQIVVAVLLFSYLGRRLLR